jgi:hypothetical protein
LPQKAQVILADAGRLRLTHVPGSGKKGTGTKFRKGGEILASPLFVDEPLQLGLGGWELARPTDGFESRVAMGAVAKGLVQGVAAAAQTDGGPSRQVERLSFGIVYRKLAFDFDGAVVVNGDLRWHVYSMLTCVRKRFGELAALSL